MDDLAAELMARCDRLAQCSEEEGCLTRTFLSPPMHQVHRELHGWMEAAGMTVRLDAAGNIVGRYEGVTEGAPAFVLGSHLDTVRNAGRYDGVLGVLAGLAVVQALHQTGTRLPFPLEIVGFSEEEGVRYGVPFLGSRAFTGTLGSELLALKDAQGVTVREAMEGFGGDVERLGHPPQPLLLGGARWLGYLELHIEQGPVLAEMDRPVGVVSAIAGSSRIQLSLTGQAGHAGTTPMGSRRDALAGAAAFVLEVERYAARVPELVATVGRLEVKPGAINVIPGEVTLTLDVRHPDDATREQAVAELCAKAEAVAGGRRLELAWQPLMHQPATPMDRGLSQLLADAAGDRTPVLPSGAGHDAQVMAEVMPAAMLFLRSPNGISHHPDETVRSEDVAEALRVMWRFLESLAEQHAL